MPYQRAEPEIEKTIYRAFHSYSSRERSNHASSHRQGHRQREATGEYYYCTTLVPDRAFPTRTAARDAAIAAFDER